MSYCQGFCTLCGTGCAQHSEYCRNWMLRYEEEVSRVAALRAQINKLENLIDVLRIELVCAAVDE